jgi:hypothetical protein
LLDVNLGGVGIADADVKRKSEIFREWLNLRRVAQSTIETWRLFTPSLKLFSLQQTLNGAPGRSQILEKILDEGKRGFQLVLLL